MARGAIEPVLYSRASRPDSGAPWRRRMSIVQNPLTLVMTIKSPADYAQLNGLLQQIQSAPPEKNPIRGALDKLKSVHFARFVFLANNTQLAVITTYDG